MGTLMLGAWACSSDDTSGSGSSGSGGSGGEGATTTTTTTTATTTTTTTAVTTTTGGGEDCDGLGVDNFQEACGVCLEANCCAELAEWDGAADLTEELNACAVDLCGDECLPPPQATVGAPECGAPVPLPEAGACVTIGDAVECNPITNEGCDSAAGEACDYNGAGFQCFPAPNDTALCDACDNGAGPFCLAGSTCVGEAGTKCAKYCCDDADCGPGTCFKNDETGDVFPPAPTVGVCVEGGGSGSGGGGGGTSGAGGDMGMGGMGGGG